ncbi:hypothetical protein ANO14919_108120 [Xylariales sp. No.14919]|nr:hypothetical protein ANO14919_108120 [Xylariales sp. No.14919]
MRSPELTGDDVQRKSDSTLSILALIQSKPLLFKTLLLGSGTNKQDEI